MNKAKPKNITRVEILVEKGQEELLTGDIYQLAGTGIWLEEQGNLILIKCYPHEPELFLHQLDTSCLKIISVIVEHEELKDYSELTKQYFRPIMIGNLTIRAPWNKKKGKGREIVIEPGMAFGTGRHESTKIMIKLMEAVDFIGKTVLDIGCGSGILALNAYLLGAGKIIAVDNDLDAVLNAKKNVSLNGAHAINLVCTNLQDIQGTYDVVLANIDIKTFSAWSETVASFVQKDGYLFVSGILRKNKDQFLQLFHGWNLVNSHRINSWWGFLLAR
jgi:ribosomal protein L11 methyltransferase